MASPPEAAMAQPATPSAPLAQIPRAVTAGPTSLTRRLWFAAAMLFVVVRSLPELTYPLGRDQGTYLTIGSSLLQGRVLYRDLWDNKPPGIFYLYAVIAKLFGRVMWSGAVVDILWLIAVSWCIFLFTERYIGGFGAAVAVAVHAEWHVWAGYIYMGQPENFQLLCVFAAFFLLLNPHSLWRNPRAVAAGVLLAAAFWLKYNAVGFAPFLVLVPYLDPQSLGEQPPRLRLTLPWRDWLWKCIVVGMSALVIVVLVFGWFWARGAWPAMREIQFEVLPRYGMMAVESRAHYLIAVAVRTTYYLGAWSEAATIVALLVAWKTRDLGRFIPIFFALVFAYLATAMQLRFHSYYFLTCFPFLAMVWSYLAVRVYEGFRFVAGRAVERGWRLAAVLLWVLFADTAYWPLPGEFDRVRSQYEDLREWRVNPVIFYSHHRWEIPIEHMGDQLKTIQYLRARSSPCDSLFVWGAHALIYYETGMRPPTRFVSNLGLVALWSPPSWRAELVRDLEASPPRFIVVARQDALPSITYVGLDSEQYLDVFPPLKDFIARHYRQAADFNSFVVYERKVSP
ncbi:MAG TPA: glycosyltransferase family 39 protein [Terriglobia bacterium]|nr:glycosyltransferase family 39 protein [Terriglobia bacterium]